MSRIIVPIDFSSTSADALRYGCYLADVTGYDLEAVHVHDGFDGDEAIVVIKGSARVRSRVLERLEKFVAAKADVQTFTGLHAEHDAMPFIKCREVVGKAANKLVALSKKEDTALVVMGGVGSSIRNEASPLFGSVARKVALKAACPVLLIPQGSGVPTIKTASIAFDQAFTLVQMSDKTRFLREALKPAIRFVHVMYAQALTEEIIELELMSEMINTSFPEYDASFDFLQPGNTTNQLNDYTLENDIDLLIVGNWPKGFFAELLIRSEVRDLIGVSSAPLLVIPLSKTA